MSDWATTDPEFHPFESNYTFTPGATAHSKGSWALWLNTGITPVECSGLYIRPEWCSDSSTLRTIIVDIAAGPDTSNLSMLIPGLIWTPGIGDTRSREQTSEVFFPIAVPAEKLWVRAQSSMSNHGAGYLHTGFVRGGAPPYGSVCDVYGLDITTSLGAAVTADATQDVFGAWTEITPSCERIRAMVIAFNSGLLSPYYSNQYTAFDIGIGPAGSELPIMAYVNGGWSSGSGVVRPTFYGPYAIDIPEGTRISIRMLTYGTASKVRYFTIYGIR